VGKLPGLVLKSDLQAPGCPESLAWQKRRF